MTFLNVIQDIVEYKINIIMIEIINAKIGIGLVVLRAEKTLEELKEKAPHKKALINTQCDSIKELQYALYVMHRMDTKIMSLQSDLHSKNTLLLELQQKVKDLEKTNQNLIDNATL
jgi:hypothetical protein